MSSDPPPSRHVVSRRAVLRRLGAGVVAATTAGTTSLVTAQSDAVTVLDLRESGDQSLPVVDELLIFVHGWHGSSAGPGQAADLAGLLSAGGYEADETVALVYRADASAPEDAFVQSEQAASDFAPIVEAAIDAGVGSIRLAAHSLGGRVVLGTVSKFDDGYVVDTVAPMGTAAVGSTVTEGGRWYEGVANHTAAVRNYHSRNDDLIMGDFGPDGRFGSPDDTALGAQGVPDPSATPDTYTDVDVTDSVSGHGGYTSSSTLAEDLAEAIDEQADRTPTPTETPTDRPEGPTWPTDPPATDPDGDALYEDVSGDGTLNFPDVNRLFQTTESAAVQDNAEYLDFDGDGDVDMQDVLALFEWV